MTLRIFVENKGDFACYSWFNGLDGLTGPNAETYKDKFKKFSVLYSYVFRI